MGHRKSSLVQGASYALVLFSFSGPHGLSRPGNLNGHGGFGELGSLVVLVALITETVPASDSCRLPA